MYSEDSSFDLVQRAILMLVRMHAEDMDAAESLLREVRRRVDGMTPEQREPLRVRLDLCCRLAERASQFWERQRAVLISSQPLPENRRTSVWHA